MRPAAEATGRRCHEPEEQARLSRMSGTQTRTLADLEGPARSRPPRRHPCDCRSAQRRAEARCARPILCDGPAQERGRARVDQTRQGRDHRERQAGRRPISPARCCACCSRSPSWWRTATTSSMCSAPSPAAGCRVRPARSGTASRRALTYYEPDLRGILKVAGFLTRDPPRGRAQEIRQGQGPTKLPVQQAVGVNLVMDRA